MGTDLQASKKVSTGTPFHLASIVNSWYVTVCRRRSRRLCSKLAACSLTIATVKQSNASDGSKADSAQEVRSVLRHLIQRPLWIDSDP
jgi:hypothetical protein